MITARILLASPLLLHHVLMSRNCFNIFLHSLGLPCLADGGPDAPSRSTVTVSIVIDGEPVSVVVKFDDNVEALLNDFIYQHGVCASCLRLPVLSRRDHLL